MTLPSMKGMDHHMKMYVNSQQTTYPIVGQQWEGYLHSLCQAMECHPDTIVSLTFADNDTLHYLNRTYRQIDKHTDVLSFPQYMEHGLLGDIIISVEQAQAQAEEKHHSLRYELALLATHGLLHLLGYDHAAAEEEAVMFGQQEELLREYFLACFGESVAKTAVPSATIGI